MPCRLSSSQDLNVRLDFLNHVSNFKKMKWLITKLISSMQEQSSILILSFPVILRKNLLRTVLIDKIIRLIDRRQLQLALSTHLWDMTGSLKKIPISGFHVGFGYKSGAGRTVSHQKSTWTHQGTCCQHLCSWQWLRPAAYIQPLQLLLSLLTVSWRSVDLRDLEMREPFIQDFSLP